MKKPVLLLCLLAPLLAPIRAQIHPPPGSGFKWERVGDVPIDASALAFGPDSLGRPGRHIFWAEGTEGIYRYDDSAGFPGRWVILQPDPRYQQPADEILPLGPDTLVVIFSYAYRSTDGGYTFELVSETQGLGHATLAEIPSGVPHAGRLLLGDHGGIQFPSDSKYSDDRGATWTVSEVPERGDNAGLTVLPAGSPHAGRVVAASRPAMLSDDGGATYYPSGLWDLSYYGELLALCERPGVPGSVRVVLEGFVNGAGGRIWRSDDGGETWDESLMEPGFSPPLEMLSLGGSTLLMVLHNGTIRRSDDGGETWTTLGRAPVPDEAGYSAKVAVLGPGGRLYVGVLRSGPNDEWVYRTAERFLPVAAEPAPEAPSSLGLEVSPNPAQGEAEVALTLVRPSAVSVALYDGLGRRVVVLHEGPLAAGRHTLPFDGADLPGGVYVVRATVGEAVVSRHVTLLP